MSLVENKTLEEKKDLNSYLTFKMDDELFALNVLKVIEILEVPQITKIPRSPAYMAGIINLRGKVLPLVDTRVKFGLEPIKYTISTCIIVIEINVEGDILQVGTLVDEVLEVIEIEKSQIQPSPSIEANYNLDFIEGMFRKDEHFIMLLNLDKVFSVQDYSYMQQNKNETPEAQEKQLPKSK